MEVTDILRDRMKEPVALQRMTTVVSACAHAGIFAAVIFMPGGLFSHLSREPQMIMTITLGGSGEGTRNSGLTPIGGRPVQTTTPAETREAVRAPAAKTPEMTLPKANAKPSKTTPPPPVAHAPDEARGRTPTRGKEVAAGSAIAETAARGQGFGLSTGGGVGSGSYVDVANFCCPDYLVGMVERIRTNWMHPPGPGIVVVKFTILRDGTVSDIMVERRSGDAIQELNAQRAVAVTKMLPLPGEFTNPVLTVHLNFQY